MLSKYYIGIDPSMSTGVVVLDDSGNVFHAQEVKLKNKSLSTTAEILAYGRDIVKALPTPRIATVCIEGFAYSATGSAVSSQYGIGYAIRFALIDAGHKYLEPTPSALKKFVTGKGTSKKEVVIKEVYKRWGYEHESNNVIDAYALARLAYEQEDSDGTGDRTTAGS